MQTAARAVAKAIDAGRPLDDVERAVVEACERMGSTPPELASGFAKKGATDQSRTESVLA
ncbi:hypothetical protein SALBM311S_12257 [Streptomyces alboniger]